MVRDSWLGGDLDHKGQLFSHLWLVLYEESQEGDEAMAVVVLVEECPYTQQL